MHSKVDLPVVTTSSTTSKRSPSLTVNPRLNFMTPFSLSVQMKRAFKASATANPIINPPIAGETTVSISASLYFSAIKPPKILASDGFCKANAH